jgi:hypothetical protein
MAMKTILSLILLIAFSSITQTAHSSDLYSGKAEEEENGESYLDGLDAMGIVQESYNSLKNAIENIEIFLRDNSDDCTNCNKKKKAMSLIKTRLKKNLTSNMKSLGLIKNIIASPKQMGVLKNNSSNLKATEEKIEEFLVSVFNKEYTGETHPIECLHKYFQELWTLSNTFSQSKEQILESHRSREMGIKKELEERRIAAESFGYTSFTEAAAATRAADKKRQKKKKKKEKKRRKRRK